MVEKEAAVSPQTSRQNRSEADGLPACFAVPEELSSAVLARLAGEGPRAFAAAPGRLDVMGGIAEYSGGLVLQVPTADRICIGAQRRDDGLVHIAGFDGADGEKATPFVVPLSKLYRTKDVLIEPADGLELLGASPAREVITVLGSLVEMVRDGLVPHLGGGITLSAASNAPARHDGGHSAAISAATMVAVGGLLDAGFEWCSAARVGQQVENEWLQVPVGLADAACALMGEPGMLLQLRSGTCEIEPSIRLPEGLAIVGVDSGVLHQDAIQKYVRVRTATLMGRALIDRIVRYEGGTQPGQFNGLLSHVSITDYVERFRDRIPTKIQGRGFIEAFGDTIDPLTTIEPDFMYKVRSRAEHHIYENARCHQFVEGLCRAIRLGQWEALHEVGELMYASTWSYGQRCGLGSVETDLLVNLIRRHGADAGVFGAKVSGRGCGGTVVVMMRTTESAREAVEHAMSDYESETGHRASLIEGTAPGAMKVGPQVC